MNISNEPFFNETGIPIYQATGGLPVREALKLNPELVKYLKSGDNEHLDFENRDLLIQYNLMVAKEIYGLEIRFGPDPGLIPTPVLRYNFLKFLLSPRLNPHLSLTILKNPKIIELGTGYSGIIALLAAKHFNARVWATEIDEKYVQLAQDNINRNSLKHQIQLIRSSGGLLDGIIPKGLKVNYIISNPPYYDKILSPKVIWGGKDHELISDPENGAGFIIRMIEEGMKYLEENGVLSFIIPKTRVETLVASEEFLQQFNYDYDIFGLRTGNRIRYVFRIHK